MNENIDWQEWEAMTHRQQIEHSLDDGEVLLCGCIGEPFPGTSASRYREGKEIKFNTLQPWPRLAIWLEYNYDCGFGLEDCFPVIVWTNRSVMFMKEYDGSTDIRKLPLNPQNFECNFL